MRKFLSVLLAVMMVVSTVSFAVPSAVTTVEDATNAVVKNTTEETTEIEEADLLADDTWYDKTKGTLLFNMDFDEDNNGNAVSASAYDNISLGTYNAGAGELVSGLGRINPDVAGNYDIGFRYTTSGSATLGDNAGNKYLSLNATTTYDQISMYLGNVFSKTGKYVLEYDYMVESSTAGFNGINYYNLPGNTTDVNVVKGEWASKSVTLDMTSVQNAGRIRWVTSSSAKFTASDKLHLDNIKVWYFDESADYDTLVGQKYVTVHSGKDGIENQVIPVAAGTSVTMQAVMALVQEELPGCIGFAETADGDILPLDTVITINSNMTFYAVWGFDASVSANGNENVSDLTVSKVDERRGITVADLMSRIDVSASTKPLLGLSTSATGTLLAADTVIKSASPLYMIWGAESLANKWYDEEMGTRVFFIDLDGDNGYITNASILSRLNGRIDGVNDTSASNGMYIEQIGRFNPEIAGMYDSIMKYSFKDGGTPTISGTDNKYFTHTATTGPSVMVSDPFVGAGTYTLVFEHSAGKTFKYQTGFSGTYSKETVDAAWERSKYVTTITAANYSSDHFRLISNNGAGTYLIDNVALYFKPTGKLDLTIAGNVYKVDAGTYTASDLIDLVKSDIPGCVGFARTTDGEVLSGDETIDINFNTTLYAVAGFDVTLKAGDNRDFSDVTLTGFNSKDGVTVGELLSKIENNTSRLVKGLSETASGALLSKDTVIRNAKGLYIIWTVDESALGTLVFNMDFEKDGIEAPSAAVSVNAITDIYNADLVPEGIKFNPERLNSFRLVTENGNTYYVANTALNDRCKLNINEFETGGFAWTNGTYTLVADIKSEAAAELSSDQFTVIEQFYNELGQWNRVSFTFNGAASSKVNESGEPYGTLNFCIQAPAGTPLSIDNVKLYFKTDVTTVTVKNGGNTEISDTVVDVSTSTGITVAELIEEVNKQTTSRTLLGLSETPTGELLDESTVITPKYPISLYAVWHSKDNNPYVDDNLGKMLFEVDFENEAVINANWAGYAELDNATNASAGERITKIASYYDPMFEGKNVRLLVRLNTSDYSQVGIKTAADGNHYIEGVINTSNPKIQILNNASLALENGVYTLYLDGIATGDGSISHQKFDPYTVTYVEGDANSDGKFDYTPAAWTTYGLSFGINDGGKLPSGQVHYNIPTGNTVAYDNVKLYYKPYKATITLNAGDYPEFGDRTVANISTTGENKGADLVAAIQADLDVCGREFVGLMDEYGDMLNLEKALVIPGDVTYTIVWGESSDIAPETVKSNSIRISTNEHSGIRFAANAKKIYTTDENTTQYGWLVVSAEKLEAKGVAPTSLTKETGAKYGINVKEGYSYKKGEIDDPIIFEQDDEEIMMTLVVYNIQAKDYAKELCVRPFIVIDDVTYYGTPFKRSIYDIAKELQGEYTHGDASDDLNGRTEQDYIDYIDNIVNTVEGTN